MKKLFFIFITVFMLCAMLQGCGAKDEAAGNSLPPETISPSPSESPAPSPSETKPEDADSSLPPEIPTLSPSERKITEETALEGVNNYCRAEYDWSIAEDNPDIMYLEMGEGTDDAYRVVFRSYTGALVYFDVDKSSGSTKLTECVPGLGIEEEVGTINLYDYLE